MAVSSQPCLTALGGEYRVNQFACMSIRLHVLTRNRVGALLYTSYLQILGNFHQPSSQSLEKVFPPPSITCTATAGFSAGAIQSVVAAPLDALSVRFRTSDILSGRYTTMWQYGQSKLREIGRSLDILDKQAKIEQPKSAMLRSYWAAYQKTYQQCTVYAQRSGGLRRWLFKGFLWNTLKQVPSTSLGLIIFELVRRRYGIETEAIRIEKDGYQIQLT